MASDVWLEIHLTELGNGSAGIPLDALSDSLRAFLNLTYLISSAFINPRAAFADARILRKEFFDAYELKCEILKAGSLDAPVILAPRFESASLFGDDDVLDRFDEFKAYYDETLEATTTANVDRILNQIPIRSNAHRVVDAVGRLIPGGNCRLELRHDSPRGRSIFDSERDQKNVREVSRHLRGKDSTPEVAPKELTLIAGVSVIDYEGGKFDASTYGGLTIQSDLHATVNNGDLLFEAPYLEIDGTYKVNKDGEVLELIQEKEKRLVDTTSIEVLDLQVRNEHLRANPPLEFKVEFDREAVCYTLEGDFEIYLYAFSREELRSSLIELLEFMWLDYALEDDDSKLDQGAKELKQNLLHRFSRV